MTRSPESSAYNFPYDFPPASVALVGFVYCSESQPTQIVVHEFFMETFPYLHSGLDERAKEIRLWIDVPIPSKLALLAEKTG